MESTKNNIPTEVRTADNHLSASEAPVIALIPAAGRGKRIGETKNKLFLHAGGRPILERTLSIFDKHPAVTDICVVTLPEEQPIIEEMIAAAGITKVHVWACGGATRRDSVGNGLAALKAAGLPDDAIVLIHDGARCFVGPEVIDRCIDGARKKKAVVAALHARDTIKFVEDDKIAMTPDRNRLWQIQTPQAFHFDLVYQAYQNGPERATDDASLVEAVGHPVYVVMGSDFNIKITTPADLLIGEAFVTYLQL